MWAGEMSGHDAILGMDGMVPAGIRLDLADGTLCLPDEVRIQLTGRRPLYGEHVCSVEPERMTSVDAAQSLEIAKLPNPEEAEITREEPVGTQADESGDQRPEGAEHASKQDARATKTDEVEKAEEPAADKQVPPIGSGYGRRGHSQVNRERHRLIDRSQTNKFASAKEANPSQKT
ncbi:hypothetical protein PC111_g13520 [Phytophthora cactorum]|nr:hypothetical protein PC111_g13520 [Phytophthora cactorum]